LITDDPESFPTLAGRQDIVASVLENLGVKFEKRGIVIY
jgi:hypothetical protein